VFVTSVTVTTTWGCSMTGVYLIHFSPAYKHAKHYLGFARDIDARLALHQAGGGARLTQVAAANGCTLILARVWVGGDRALERKLKGRKNAPALCPICGLSFSLDDVEELAF